MRPSFSSLLVNDPFGDPGVYVDMKWARRALLFDLGNNEALTPTLLLRASDLFVSHTHMDHFIGFDRVLRTALGRGKTLRLFGPPGLIANVSGKLQGYTWNLVDGYPLSIHAHEYHPQEVRSATFFAAEGFRRRDVSPQSQQTTPSSHLFPVLDDPMFTIRAVALNHRISCFGYAMEERFHVNVNKERLHAAGLPVGSWLKDVKRYLWEGRPDDFRFTATLYLEHRKEEREFRLGDVRKRFVTITRGQKLAYVVDVRYDEDNEAKIVELARGADVFYCESPYLDQDADKARERYHLTARQAGVMAKRADVCKLVVFHFSPRYTGQGEAIRQEAQGSTKPKPGAMMKMREFGEAPRVRICLAYTTLPRK